MREWSTIIINNHPSNPHSHPLPAFSTSKISKYLNLLLGDNMFGPLKYEYPAGTVIILLKKWMVQSKRWPHWWLGTMKLRRSSIYFIYCSFTVIRLRILHRKVFFFPMLQHTRWYLLVIYIGVYNHPWAVFILYQYNNLVGYTIHIYSWYIEDPTMVYI